MLKVYLINFLAATIAASSGVIIKTARLPSTTMTFFRLVVPTIILFFYLKFKKIKLFRGNYKIMLLSSFLNAVRMWFYILAFKFTTVGNGTIILFTWPVFATIFGTIFLKEKLEKKVLVLILSSFIGVIIVSFSRGISFKNNDFNGMVIMLFSAIIFALTTIIFKKEAENYSKEETVFYQNILGAIIFLPFVFVNRPLPTFFQVSLGLSYGILVGVVAFILFFYSLKRLEISKYSLITYWEVPCATFFGIIFLGEKISWNTFVGGGLILFSGIFLVLSKYFEKTKVLS